MDWGKEIIRIFEKYDNKLNLQQIFSYIENRLKIRTNLTAPAE